MADDLEERRVITHVVALLGWLLLLGTLFAQAEIQVEGPNGWAAALPTWRIVDGHVLKALFGGRVVTGYHVFIFAFMFSVFHLPAVLTHTFSLRLEARILGSLMLFWVIEDVMWFAMNPAYGLGRLNAQGAPWHPHWCFGVPVDYLLFTGLASMLLPWSFRRDRSRDGTPTAALTGSVAEEP